MIKCPECGHQVSDKAATCPSCGVKIAGNIVKCEECGCVTFKDQTVCPACHAPLVAAPACTPAQVMAEEPARPAGLASAVDPEATETDPTAPAGEQPNPKKKAKTLYTIIAIAFVVIAALAFVVLHFYGKMNAQNEMDAYQNAMTSAEPAVLQNYLDIYPDAPVEHRDSVMAHLQLFKQADSEWTDAVVSRSKDALTRYMRLHPGSVHEPEAKLMIDSIDWAAATKADTPESYKAYIDAHLDGTHKEEAEQAVQQLTAKRLSDDEKTMVSHTFTVFFNALSNKSEAELTSTVSSQMKEFLHHANATHSDVVSYMNKLHSRANITSLTFRPNNDWQIEKQSTGDDLAVSYSVTFTVDQKTEYTDPAENTLVTYGCTAAVDELGKITELNMKKK